MGDGGGMAMECGVDVKTTLFHRRWGSCRGLFCGDVGGGGVLYLDFRKLLRTEKEVSEMLC